MKRRIIIIVGSAVLVGAIVAAVLLRDSIIPLFRSFSPDTVTTTGPDGCNEQTLVYVREALVYPYDFDRLSRTYESIIKDEDYKNNASCLYVVASYHMQAGDLTAARSVMVDLQSAYKAEGSYEEALNGYTLRPDTLDEQLSLREASIESIDTKTPDGLDSPYDEPPMEAE